MKLRYLLLLSLVIGPAAFGGPLVLSDGAYQLIRAYGAQESSDLSLSAVVVHIIHRQGKAYIVFDDRKEAEIRTDNQGGFLVALSEGPDNPDTNAWVNVVIFAGRGFTFPAKDPEAAATTQVQGKFYHISPGGLSPGMGHFSLVSLGKEKG